MRAWLLSIPVWLLALGAARALTTKDFLFRCSQDEAACVAKIDEVRHRMEYPPAGRPVTKICPPDDIGTEELIRAVTTWIDDQGSRYDNREDGESIAAALQALYPCTGMKDT